MSGDNVEVAFAEIVKRIYELHFRDAVLQRQRHAAGGAGSVPGGALGGAYPNSAQQRGVIAPGETLYDPNAVRKRGCCS